MGEGIYYTEGIEIAYRTELCRTTISLGAETAQINAAIQPTPVDPRKILKF